MVDGWTKRKEKNDYRICSCDSRIKMLGNNEDMTVSKRLCLTPETRSTITQAKRGNRGTLPFYFFSLLKREGSYLTMVNWLRRNDEENEISDDGGQPPWPFPSLLQKLAYFCFFHNFLFYAQLVPKFNSFSFTFTHLNLFINFKCILSLVPFF